MTDGNLKRYELFGWDYPLVNPLSDQEVGWYRGYAERTGGPVLGLACGTGRLLCRLAEAGFEVVGIDITERMLDLARGFAAELDEVARKRITLIRGDMAEFDLGRQFGLITVADNSFRELATREQHLACLRCVRRHLRDDGIFLMTERRFQAHLYPGGRREFGWSEPTVDPRSGCLVARRGELRLVKDGTWISGAFHYRITTSDGSERIECCPIESPILLVEDYHRLFSEAGLSAELYVGYEHRSDDGQDPILCFVAR